MFVKNTFHTLFDVSDGGLKLLADFVTKSEAEEWAQQQHINSYLVLETVVNHEVKITQQVTPARALRLTGEPDPVSSGAEPLTPRSGPIAGVRTVSAAKPADTSEDDHDLKVLEQSLQAIMQQIETLKRRRDEKMG